MSNMDHQDDIHTAPLKITASDVRPGMWIWTDVIHEVLFATPYIKSGTSLVLIVCENGYRLDLNANKLINLANEHEIAEVKEYARRRQAGTGLSELAQLILNHLVPMATINIMINASSSDEVHQIAKRLSLHVTDTTRYLETDWHYPDSDNAVVTVTWSFYKEDNIESNETPTT